MDAIQDYDLLGRQLIKAVRGRRSQVDLSRRLGYRSNMVHRWEAGECAPSAAAFLRMCERQRIDVAQAFTHFYGRRPPWLSEVEAASTQGIAAFLRDQKGKVALGELARRTGYNRFSLSRWLKGTAEPRLGELLNVLEVATQRMLDFVAVLTDPSKIPLLSYRWSRLNRVRNLAYDQPWSHAVLRALEIADYRDGRRSIKYLAGKLGVNVEVVERALEALVESGQVQRTHDSYRVDEISSVNTGRDPVRARELKLHWTEEAVRRLANGRPGLFGYSVFAIGRAELLRMRELQLEYVRAMEALVQQSQRSDCVGLYCVQLLDLDGGPDNALTAGLAPVAVQKGTTSP